MKKWKQLKSKWWLRLICWFVCESHDLQVSSVYYFITNICTLINLLNRVWKIINNNWMRLSKIWFVYLPEASRSIIQLRQVVDLWDTDKSRYFAITEFNNLFYHSVTNAITGRRKAWFHLRLNRILFATKHSWTTLCMSGPLFCRQLFAGHVVSSWPMKGENNLHAMIILCIILSIVNKLHVCSLFFLSFLHLLHINFVLFDFRFTGLLASALALHPRHLTGNILIRVKRTVSCQEWPHSSSTMYMLNQYTTHLTRWLQHD